MGATSDVRGLTAAQAARLPASLPVPVAEGGTGSATAAAALTALGGIGREAWTSPAFAPAPADTIRAYFSPPFGGAEIKAITVGARGTAPTAGTVAFTRGVSDGGATLLDAATYSLSGLSDDTLTAMTLTATTADLQGGLTQGFLMTVTNSDGTIFASVSWGPQ